ncbi:stage III sporulation protein AE [Paenibacillus thermoaerophilus]|uniref:Stage III sporulation protein AE n=1 Tax=Paenibacillus thermoaerophilus TaxID=1215385 RepID=A0ABW2V552_9BACL|nr:stage III sporulation protein AE [Paenibacillus thermoaerophilus]TMV18789.1 stage III sporulation protein AE [Paenibacillus thermoaerophilus]
MRWIAAVGLAIALFAGFPWSASAASPETSQAPPERQVRELTERQSGELDLTPMENYWRGLTTEYGSYLPQGGQIGFKDMLLGENGQWSIGGVLSGLLRYLFSELIGSGRLLISLVLLTVFSMVLETMQSAFEKNNVGQIAYMICYLALILVAVHSFGLAIQYAKGAISGMTHFMVAMVPMLLALLASMGNIASAAILHPMVVFMVHVTGALIYAFVFPLLFFSALLHIVSAMSDKFKVTALANLLRNGSMLVLGTFVTVFLGVVSVKGATGAITDGMTIRTAKYVTSNFVPVVGRMFSDATDTVLGASLLVKNAVGLAGVVILLLLCAFPAVKILAIALIYHLAAAVLQPLGDSPIIGCLQTIGKSMNYVFAALAAVGLMFFLAITMIIAAGNLAVMVR